MARQNEPPVLIPGLELEIMTSPGSGLSVLLDSMAYDDVVECLPLLIPTDSIAIPIVHLVVDGVIVASRGNRDPFDQQSSYMISWQGDVSAGIHQISVLVEANAPHALETDFVNKCVGHATDPERQARLSVIELRGP